MERPQLGAAFLSAVKHRCARFASMGLCAADLIECSIAVVPHMAGTCNLTHETSGNIVRTAKHHRAVG